MPEVSVLVVDGREQEREALRAELRDLGHEVTLASSEEEALALFSDTTVPIEVVLVSSRVAGIRASPLLRAAQKHRADVEFVVTWDDACRGEALDFVAAGAVTLVRRPYDPAELAAGILGAAERRWLRAVRNHEEALRAVLASVEPEKLPKAIVTAWAHALGADRAQLLFATVDGLSTSWCYGPGMPSDSLACKDWLAELREPVICERRDGRPLDSAAAGIRGHEVLFPLCAGERLVGVLWAVRAIRPFLHREIAAMSVFASAARTAIENAQYRRHIGIAQQLATVGQIASGVADELRAPLSYLRDSGQIVTDGLTALQAAAAEGELPSRIHGQSLPAFLNQLAQAARDAGTGAARLNDIVADLDALVRSDDSTRIPLDLNDAVRAAVRMTAVEVRGRAKVITKLADPVRITGSRGRLTQLLVNLIVRAAHSVGAERAREGLITIATRVENGRALVEISDNGPGVSRELLARLFEMNLGAPNGPQGPGLALHLCQEIARRHGGQLRAWSRQGAGTTLVLDLPADGSTEVAPRPAGTEA
jgi:signal transduction histidine kinase/DNA-binding NarL/FixJ family response regulator